MKRKRFLKLASSCLAVGLIAPKKLFKRKNRNLNPKEMRYIHFLPREVRNKYYLNMLNAAMNDTKRLLAELMPFKELKEIRQNRARALANSMRETKEVIYKNAMNRDY